MKIKEGDKVILNDRHQKGFAWNWTWVYIPRIQTVVEEQRISIYLNRLGLAYPKKAFAVVHNGGHDED